MEELEAAVGEQSQQSSGLASALEAKSERVKALEETVHSLRSADLVRRPRLDIGAVRRAPLADRSDRGATPSEKSDLATYRSAVLDRERSEGYETTPLESPGRSEELLREMHRLRIRMGELERAAEPEPQTPELSRYLHRAASASSLGESFADSGPSRPSSVSGRRRDRMKAETPASSVSGASAPRSRAGYSARSDGSAGLITGWEYRPQSGDPVDAAVASLVNRGRYRSWRALLCRLEQGAYLCGTRRVQLRVDGETIEASSDGQTWVDLENLMRGAEASRAET